MSAPPGLEQFAGEARTGPIFKRREIVNFVVSAYRCNRRPHRSIKIRSNDTQVNSLTAIDGHDRQYFNELRSTVVSCRIFIRSQSLIAR